MSIVQPICRKHPLAYCLSIILALILLGGSGCVTAESGNHSAKISPEPVQADDNPREKPEPNNVARQLDELVIPKLVINDEYPDDVLREILPREFLKADPEGIGVNIVPMLKLPDKWDYIHATELFELGLNLNLTDTTLREVLDIIVPKLAPQLLVVGHAVVIAHPLIAANANVPRFDDLDAQGQKVGEPSKVSQKLDEIVIPSLVIDNETLDDVLNEILPRVFKREDPEGIGIKIVSELTVFPPAAMYNSPDQNGEPLFGEELVKLYLRNVTPRDVLNLLALQFFLKIHVTDSEVVVTELPRPPCYGGAY